MLRNRLFHYSVVALAAAFAGPAWGAWTKETVNRPQPDSIIGPSFAVRTVGLGGGSSSEYTYVAWIKQGYPDNNDGLIVGARVGAGPWTFQFVEDLGKDTQLLANNFLKIQTSIAIDSLGVPHAVYIEPPWGPADVVSSRLRYARRVTAGTGNCGGLAKNWRCETIGPSGNGFHGGLLAIAPNGGRHVAYSLALPFPTLWHMNSFVGVWAAPTWVNHMGIAHALRVDANNKVHILYAEHGSGAVRYANNTGGTWSNETVPGEATVDSELHRMGFQVTDKPAACVQTSSGIRYLRRDGPDNWFKSTVSGSGPFRLCALEVLQNGQPAVAYFRYTSPGVIVGELRLARGSLTQPISWTQETIDPTTANPLYLQVARRANGKLMVMLFVTSDHVRFYSEQ